MNEERREFIQGIKDFNYSQKDHYAQKFFGKSYRELTGQERLTVDDMIEGDNE
jgi:hypothetical protein